MQIAIAVGTLLLGGWILETPEETNESAATEHISPSVTVPEGTPSRQRCPRLRRVSACRSTRACRVFDQCNTAGAWYGHRARAQRVSVVA